MAASVAVSQTQQQRNVGGKQRMLSHLESNKENLPFEMQSTKMENHLERMDISPLNRGEVKGKHLSQSDKVKEKVVLRDRINAQQYSKGGNQKVKATSGEAD